MSDVSDFIGFLLVGTIVVITLPIITNGQISFPWLPFGGGGTFSGKNIYRTTGRNCRGVTDNKTISCSSGGSSPTRRVNFNSCSLTNYELTAKLKFGGGCGCGGDEATIKHLGPNHSQDGNCCWSLSAVMQNGDVCFGGEGPHPHTQKCQRKIGNVGNLQGKTIVIKSIIWKIGNGWHQELWIDKTGFGNKFAKIGNGINFTSWGNDETTNRVAAKGGPQQVELRADCSGAQWISWELAEIVPGSAGSGVAIAADTSTKEYAPAIEVPMVSEVPTFPIHDIPQTAEAMLTSQLDYVVKDLPKPKIVEYSYLARKHMNRGTARY